MVCQKSLFLQCVTGLLRRQRYRKLNDRVQRTVATYGRSEILNLSSFSRIFVVWLELINCIMLRCILLSFAIRLRPLFKYSYFEYNFCREKNYVWLMLFFDYINVVLLPTFRQINNSMCKLHVVRFDARLLVLWLTVAGWLVSRWIVHPNSVSTELLCMPQNTIYSAATRVSVCSRLSVRAFSAGPRVCNSPNLRNITDTARFKRSHKINCSLVMKNFATLLDTLYLVLEISVILIRFCPDFQNRDSD